MAQSLDLYPEGSLMLNSNLETGSIRAEGSASTHVGHNICIHNAPNTNQIMADLCETDPRDDKTRIQDANGGLLRDSYRWILDHSDFLKWRNDPQSQLLWIKGDPGKGKTMLLCGIIDELEKEPDQCLSYFFCQTTEARLNNATAVLRGLIWLLVSRNPSLISHVRKKYDYAGKKAFEDGNAWETLSKILASITNDPNLNGAVLAIDALDECDTKRHQLLDFIKRPSRVKWIISGRNWHDMEESLVSTEQRVWLQLDLNQDLVSEAVDTYIDFKVDQLARIKKYDKSTKDTVWNYLSANADGTFLWVALVCQELENDQVTRRRHTISQLQSFPSGLDPLYMRMMENLSGSRDADLCKEILAIALVVYRPVARDELTVYIDSMEQDEYDDLPQIIKACGAFLALREGVVRFVHQSAKDFLLKKVSQTILPNGAPHQHYTIFSKSQTALSKVLKFDICDLGAPGFPADQVPRRDLDALASLDYACVFWVDHLCDSGAASEEALHDNGDVYTFIHNKYLYWLEFLSLLRSIPQGIKAVHNLEALALGPGRQNLLELLRDARRFILTHKIPIETAPLQAYASALVFSPQGSRVRELFKHEEPNWLVLKPRMESNWDTCLQTLEGHSNDVTSVVFSADGQHLASGSDDKTVKIWDRASGDCLQTLEGHTDAVTSVVFSADSQRLASCSKDSTVKIWNCASGNCLETLQGPSHWVAKLVFSADGQHLASVSYDETVKIWDRASGDCLQTLEGHTDAVTSVVFSADGQHLTSGSFDKTIKIWDRESGNCLQILQDPSHRVTSVVFSADGQHLASGSWDKTVKIWDRESGNCLQILKGHSDNVTSVVFSGDSQRLASCSKDSTIKVWDRASGNCLQTLKGHSDDVTSVVFSADSKHLASGSRDKTIKIWDHASGDFLQTLEGHSDLVTLVVFLADGQHLLSGSWDKTVKIWDRPSGDCLQTLQGPSHWVTSLVFSADSQHLASVSWDKTVKIWDRPSGDCLQTLEGHSDKVTSVVFSADGQHLASGSWDKTVKIWDRESGNCLQILQDPSHRVTSVVFSADGQHLASGSWDKTVKIWDRESGNCLQILKGHRAMVTSVVFSADSQRLASCSDDSTVKIWNRASGNCLQTFHMSRPVYRLSFDPTGSIRLFTDTGLMELEILSPAAHVEVQMIGKTIRQPANYKRVRLSSDGVWVIKDGERMLWLPPAYRSRNTTVLGFEIAIGCSSGSVIMMKIADHPSTLAGMANLASTYRNQGRWQDAEELEVQVMDTRKTKLGWDHPSTLISMGNLACIYWSQKRPDEAVDLMRRCVKEQKKNIAEHPKYRRNYRILTRWESMMRDVQG